MKRRDLMKAAPAAFAAVPATLAAGAAPVVREAQPDPIVKLVAQWRQAISAFVAASCEPGGGNFDTPACIHWSDERDKLEDQIKTSSIISGDGAAALIEFIWEDGGERGKDWLEVQGWALETLHKWATQNPQTGGAA